MSRSLVSCCRPLLALALAAAFSGGAPAASPSTSAPSATAQVETLQRMNAALVGLQVQAVTGASSAESLGRTRSGSGVVIGDDGLILTIGYLLLEAQSIEVRTQDGRSVPARAVAYDLATGFGLIRPLVPLRGVQAVALTGTAAPSTGDRMLVGVGGRDGGIGMTQLVSKRAFSGNWEYHLEAAFFTSPPAPNHSGAPLFSLQGDLLGIGSLFTTDAAGKGPRSLPGNMFVPVDLLRPVLAELEATGSTRASRRPWIGLSSGALDGQLQVLRVTRDSPAEAAGLRPGDVVLEIDGTRVATPEALYKQLWMHAEPDDEIELTVRQGEAVRKIRFRAVDRMQTLRKPEGI
ncbi:MAG: serine protease [Variovorax sp.]|nr:MAG: serine protease [Variovorax sp.]